MNRVLKILFCDDDRQFAETQVENLLRKLKTRHKIPEGTCLVRTISSLAELRQLARKPKEAFAWDAVFCDLGWGDLNLEGIQILHDLKMNHPHNYTLLYTAQDEDETIGQALEWKLHFIDKVLKVGERGFFEKLLATVVSLLHKEDEVGGSYVSVAGTRLLPEEVRDSFTKKVAAELSGLKTKVGHLLRLNKDQTLAAEIAVSARGLKVRLKPDPDAQKAERFEELLRNLQRFPTIESHDLLPLSKPAYIEFVKQTYGGFPQMADARGLDLNNIYRVNRRFKNALFIVFKYETIQEMVGILDPKEREAVIRTLLCPPKILAQMSE